MVIVYERKSGDVIEQALRGRSRRGCTCFHRGQGAREEVRATIAIGTLGNPKGGMARGLADAVDERATRGPLSFDGKVATRGEHLIEELERGLILQKSLEIRG